MKEWLFGNTDSRTYAALRIAFGILCSIRVWILWPLAHLHIPSAAIQPVSPYLLGGTLDSTINGVFALVLLLGVSLIVGFWSRLSAGLLWIVFLIIYHNFPLWSYGGDGILRSILFFLMLSESGNDWSVDRFIMARRSPSKTSAPAWPLRVIQIQLGAIYLAAGISKLTNADWIHGHAVSLILADPLYSRFDLSFLHKFPLIVWTVRLLSVAVPVWEIIFSFLLHIPKLRGFLLLCGVAFHLCTCLLLRIEWFGPIMIAYYLVFLTPKILNKTESTIDQIKTKFTEGSFLESNFTDEV